MFEVNVSSIVNPCSFDIGIVDVWIFRRVKDDNCNYRFYLVIIILSDRELVNIF